MTHRVWLLSVKSLTTATTEPHNENQHIICDKLLRQKLKDIQENTNDYQVKTIWIT